MSARSEAIKIALDVIERGYNPVPIPRGKKSPTDRQWQKIRRTREKVSKYFSNGVNVGAQMGPMSNGLTDVDLDCEEAVTLASCFLPSTGAVYGRASKQCSHHLYICDDPEPRAWIQWKDEKQVPGSVHTSAEIYEWDSDEAPAKVPCAELKAACIKLAAASLLMRHWPGKGALHDTALGVGGFLARAGWERADVEHFVCSNSWSNSRRSPRQRRTADEISLFRIRSEERARLRGERKGTENPAPAPKVPHFFPHCSPRVRAPVVANP